MRDHAHASPLAKSTKSAPSPQPRMQKARALEAADQAYDQRMQQSLVERARQPVQAKAAIDTGYADLVAAARHVPGKAVQRAAAGGVSAEGAAARGRQPNATGLSDRLKAGIETLSGMNLDDVRVHYGSEKPRQLSAFAYTRGSDIYVAPGQERHVPHEAWHVVQQKQGRVRATTQLMGVGLNDDTRLEREADVMGQRATALAPVETHEGAPQKCSECAGEDKPHQRVRSDAGEEVMQLACYFFKNADCQGQRVWATSKHNYSDWATYNCSGERGGDDCVVNDGVGHCACPGQKEEESDDKPAKTGPVSAYDDPTTSRFSRALIERGLATGTYPPRR